MWGLFSKMRWKCSKGEEIYHMGVNFQRGGVLLHIGFIFEDVRVHSEGKELKCKGFISKGVKEMFWNWGVVL